MSKVREQEMDEKSMAWLEKGGWAVFSRQALSEGRWSSWKIHWPLGQAEPEGVFTEKIRALEFAAALGDEFSTHGKVVEVMVVETSPVVRTAVRKRA